MAECILRIIQNLSHCNRLKFLCSISVFRYFYDIIFSFAIFTLVVFFLIYCTSILLFIFSFCTQNCHWFIILLHASNYWRIFLSFTDSINGLLNPWVNKLTWELISRRFMVIIDADRPYPINFTRSINHKRRIYCAKNSKIAFDPTAARWRLNRMCETFLAYSHVVERSQKLKTKIRREKNYEKWERKEEILSKISQQQQRATAAKEKSLVRAL